MNSCFASAAAYNTDMASIDVATLKQHAEELFAKAVSGEATVIEQNGKRAVLLPCDNARPDFELFPELDALIRERVNAPAREATESDWEALRRRVLDRK
jgi:hypothetical protein